MRAALAAMLLATAPASAGSLRFVESKPTAFDFADIPAVPKGFGAGEFSLELWVKPDAGYPVGPVWRASYNQLKNWSDADPEPYTSDGWWLSGNWLLDGHTRPEGFSAGDSREGTFSLQFYGGGRLRWMFADAKAGMPKGMVHAVQAWPAATTPSLLDGRWHHIVAVRRWRQPTGATLELWIDGKTVATTEIATRTDMSRLWSKLSHPADPAELGGWALGSEVMTAWNYTLTQYEDYKGLLDDLAFWGRALTPEEIAMRASGAGAQGGWLAHFGFDERRGTRAADSSGSGLAIELHRATADSWSAESRPQR